MTDLDAAIRAKLDRIAEQDGDCTLQCGASCASGGYGLAVDALLALLDLHKPFDPGDGPVCEAELTGVWAASDPKYPCATVLAIAKALGIEAHGA